MADDKDQYTSRGFAEAVAILASYEPDARFRYHFKHDQMWFGPDADKVSPEHAARLWALGWFIDEDSWSVYS